MMTITTYRHSKRRTFILPLLLFIVLETLVVGFFIFEERSTPMLGSLLINSVVINLSICFLLVFNQCYRIEILEDKVKIFRFGRQTMVLPFDRYSLFMCNYSQSKVGADPSIKRDLEILSYDGRTKTMYLRLFSDKTVKLLSQHFEKADYIGVQNFTFIKKSPVIKAEEGFFLPEEGIQLNFPRKQLMNVISRRFSIQSLILSLSVLSIYAIYFFAFYRAGLSLVQSIQLTYPWLLAPALAALAGIISLGVYYFIQCTKIPEQIRFSQGAMAFDNLIFFRRGFFEWQLTNRIVIQRPFRIGRNTRKVVIKTLQGKYTFFFGHINSKKGNFFYEDYGVLVDALEAFWAEDSPPS